MIDKYTIDDAIKSITDVSIQTVGFQQLRASDLNYELVMKVMNQAYEEGKKEEHQSILKCDHYPECAHFIRGPDSDIDLQNVSIDSYEKGIQFEHQRIYNCNNYPNCGHFYPLIEPEDKEGTIYSYLLLENEKLKEENIKIRKSSEYLSGLGVQNGGFKARILQLEKENENLKEKLADWENYGQRITYNPKETEDLINQLKSKIETLSNDCRNWKHSDKMAREAATQFIQEINQLKEENERLKINKIILNPAASDVILLNCHKKIDELEKENEKLKEERIHLLSKDQISQILDEAKFKAINSFRIQDPTGQYKFITQDENQHQSL